MKPTSLSFMELVKKRESTRKYSPQPVPRHLIDECLEAARLAPSACNSQPWSFLIVDDAQLVKEIAQKTMTGLYSLNSWVTEVPVLVVTITENSRYAARMAGMLRNVKYNRIDIGVACDHLTLRAAEIGLGTCWLGWFNEKVLKKILGLPKSTQVDVVLTLGYPAENTEPRDKLRKSLEDIRRYYEKD